jgi:Uncharacterized protein conserved in bacteria (DUF2314)
MADDSEEVLDLASWALDDGEAVHGEAPHTFLIPPLDKRTFLVQGDVVRLIFRIVLRNMKTGEEQVEVERMWVMVQRREGSGYSGILDNDPYCTGDLKSGDTVRFEPRHVIQVHRCWDPSLWPTTARYSLEACGDAPLRFGACPE